MKRKIKYAAYALIFVLVIETILLGLSSFRNSRCKEWGVKISASEVTSTGLKLLTERKKCSVEDVLMLDWRYELQKRTLFGWKNVEPLNNKWSGGEKVSFIETGRMLTREIKWETVYGKLKPGIYRVKTQIVKQEWISSPEDERNKQDMRMLYATFCVNL